MILGAGQAIVPIEEKKGGKGKIASTLQETASAFVFVNMSLGTVVPGVSISVTELFETVGFVFVPCLVNSAFSMSSMELHSVVWPLPLLGKPSQSFDRPALYRKSGGKFWLAQNSEAAESTNAQSLTPFTSNPDHCARRTFSSLTQFSYL